MRERYFLELPPAVDGRKLASGFCSFLVDGVDFCLFYRGRVRSLNKFPDLGSWDLWFTGYP